MRKMDNYKLLIKKYITGDLSDLEKLNLTDWLSKDKKNELIFKDEIKKWSNNSQQYVKIDYKIAFSKITEKINPIKSKNNFAKKITPYLKYAAVIVGFILCTSAYFLLNTSVNNTNSQIVSNENAINDAIIITKSDGTTVYVDPNSNGNTIVSKKGEFIGKKEKDMLIIDSKKSFTNDQLMTVQIPKGKSFKMMLSDKTIVWLNAGSSLTFPENFSLSQKYRTVSLKGEAYFDVSTNKEHPFVVKTNEINIEVLGTQFNVSSYKNETFVKTTLVEGSVRIADQKSNLTLVPGHQALFNKNNKTLNQKKVNIDNHVSWMDSKIVLNDESFINFSKKIERAYNVNITSTNKQLNKTQFTGIFNIKKEKIEDVLKVLSKTTSFTYTIKDNNIIIK